MENALAVCVVDGIADVEKQCEHFVECQLALFDELIQRNADDKVHDEIETAVAALARVDHADDRRMIEMSDRFDLALEALDRARLKAGVQQLDGHAARSVLVLRLEHLALSAARDFSHDLVAGDLGCFRVEVDGTSSNDSFDVDELVVRRRIDHVRELSPELGVIESAALDEGCSLFASKFHRFEETGFRVAESVRESRLIASRRAGMSRRLLDATDRAIRMHSKRVSTLRKGMSDPGDIELQEVTALLGRVHAGDEAAHESLMSLVYDDLRAIARKQIVRNEVGRRSDGTFAADRARQRSVSPVDQTEAALR